MKPLVGCLLFLVVLGACFYVYNRHDPYARAPIPHGHEYTAEGVYFLRTAQDVSGSSGTMKWKPGQQLFADRLAKTTAPEGTRQVTDGSHSATIPVNMLSEDVQEGRTLQALEEEAEEKAEAQARAEARAQAAAHAAADAQARAKERQIAAAPPEPVVRLAPEGTFFLTQYVSVRTTTGMVGFEPGHEVKLVSVNREKQTLTVTDGKYQTEVGPMQITNDLDVAAMVQRQDQAAQNQIAAMMERDRLASQKAERQEAIKNAAEMSRVGNASAGVGVGKSRSSLNDKSEPARASDRARIRRGSAYDYLSGGTSIPDYGNSLRSVGGG